MIVRGDYHSMQGAFEQARRLIGLGIEIMEALGMTGMVGVHEMVLGGAETEAGDPIAAERAYRRSYEMLDEIGAEGFKTSAAALLARTLCDLGRFDEAEGYATIARGLASEDDLGPQVVGRSAQAIVLAARGRFAEAEQLAREAVQMLEDAEWPEGQGDVRMDLARVLRMAGNYTEAEQTAREALEFYERKGNRPSSASTRAFLRELGNSGP